MPPDGTRGPDGRGHPNANTDIMHLSYRKAIHMDRRQITPLFLALALGTVGCSDPNDAETSNSATSGDTSDATTGGTSDTATSADTTGTTTSSSTTSAGTDSGTPGDCADPTDPAASKMGLSGEITSDTTLTCDTIWILEDHVFVRGAVLTIEPGTTIQGLGGSALVIDVDARIEAEGTADAPIVMTSNQPPGSRNRGDWGGLVLLGQAPINLAGGSGQAEGFANPPTYGGNDPSHDCGTLRYVRVEFAGFEIAPGSELNGITFYACGTETTVEYVQSHMGADDGMEMFGGSFIAKHVVVTGAADDSIDCDQGFRGKLQYGLVVQDPALGDNGFEWSNQGTDFTAMPLTGPVVSNFTLIGSGPGGDKSKGATFKEGTEGFIHNSMFVGFTNEAFLLAHPETQAVAEGGGIVVTHTLFFANGTPQFDTDDGAAWAPSDFENFVLDASNANLDGTDPMLASTEWPNVDPTPAMGSPVAGAGADVGDPDLEPTDYIGAVEPGATEAWFAGWTNFSPN
ncbi:MAG: hypothetical protein D6705_07950 [Deltaproteobacteria bacterium]|nr:MAG: hypothetical protein D6705_07950 [Deltaproteobacteria bacterium]